MHPSEKNHKTADRKGGGGGGATLTVSLTVKYPLFFLMTSLIVSCCLCPLHHPRGQSCCKSAVKKVFDAP